MFLNSPFYPVVKFCATLALITLPSTFSSAGNNESSTPPPDLENNILGSAESSNSAWKGAEIQINELKKTSNEGYASLTWTLVNESQEQISLTGFNNRTYLYRKAAAASGVVLIDENASIRYNPLMDSEGDCICAGADYSPGKFVLQTEPGASTTYWASYQLSEDTETVTVEIPGFLPIKDVPVG
ncbi:hypothetical protein ACQEU5_14780 [Marinactinospora thermotolerans]|uniref:hypothetical protein n=1 Tax=Marinactinospora thermotolerans TaxID=531310 RepID=UPI003D911329